MRPMITTVSLLFALLAGPPEDLGEAERSELPISLADELPVLPGAPDRETEFSFGPAGGFLHARGADRGTWFAGAQARFHFLRYLAAEGSITFHENHYEGGDARVTQYPVQVSGMFYPIPDGEFRPYIVAGAGWYYTRI